MSEFEADATSQSESANTDRRTFLSTVSSLTMTGGLVGGYGAFGAMAGRYLYPADDQATGWMFVSQIDAIKPGEAKPYTTPTGATITVARQGDTGDVSDFIALSSVCPHLGCAVHWEEQNSRFFCPCHNGVFDPQGKGTGGPPGDAGQSLKPYPLKIENGLLFIEVPLTSV